MLNPRVVVRRRVYKWPVDNRVYGVCAKWNTCIWPTLTEHGTCLSEQALHVSPFPYKQQHNHRHKQILAPLVRGKDIYESFGWSPPLCGSGACENTVGHCTLGVHTIHGNLPLSSELGPSPSSCPLPNPENPSTPPSFQTTRKEMPTSNFWKCDCMATKKSASNLHWYETYILYTMHTHIRL